MKTKAEDTPLPVADGDVETIYAAPDKEGFRKPLFDRVRWGMWHVQHWTSKKGEVKMFFGSRLVMNSDGIIAFQNACEFIHHFHEVGYAPKFPGKCLADYSPGQRQDLCINMYGGGGMKPPQAPWKGAGR